MREALVSAEMSGLLPPDPVDVSIAQMLGLAKAARIEFDVNLNRLIIRSANADWKLWPPVRRYLDEIGVDAIVDYFNRTSREERTRLSAPAAGVH